MASSTKAKNVRRGPERDPGQRPGRRRLSRQERQKRRRRKLAAMLAVEFVLLLLLGVGVWGISKLDKIQDLGVNKKDITINDMDDATEEVLKGYTNIALFGIDTREVGELGAGNRSDTIMIASINNDTKKVKLVSVYRDTYMNRETTPIGAATRLMPGEAPPRL